MKGIFVQLYNKGWLIITVGEGKKRLEGKTQSWPMKKTVDELGRVRASF